MRHILYHVRGIAVFCSGILFAPFLPFPLLFLFPFTALFLSAPVAALCFSLFADAFLLPAGVPLFGMLTSWTLLSFLLVTLVRYLFRL